ncbi:MAG: MotA/TolQ/ExbB proton channel family protein [Elusimicrobia bacterium]|nr:MotA/TolQ/ExbB proton channel family protein [Elusimicrobiota bacterium]
MFGKVWEMIIAGGPVMFPIIALSLIIWTLIIEKYFSLKSASAHSDSLADDVVYFLKIKKTKIASDMCRDSSGLLPAAARLILTQDNKSKSHLLKIARQIFHETYPLMEKYLPTIAVFAQASPLLGLLGTVTGMVSTFTSISMHGTGDPQALAKGISQALITTQAGLIVAIPSLFFYNHLVRKADGIMNEMEKSLTKIINALE